jgi:uncharacterized protein YidB (DUF937 family)
LVNNKLNMLKYIMDINTVKDQLSNILSSNIDIQGKIEQATGILTNAGIPQDAITQVQDIISQNGGIEQVLSVIQSGGLGEMVTGMAGDMAMDHAAGGIMDQLGGFFGGNEGGE